MHFMTIFSKSAFDLLNKSDRCAKFCCYSPCVIICKNAKFINLSINAG